jgi:hypothetical protein
MSRAEQNSHRILAYGHDVVLLKTRCMVLQHAGFGVDAADSLEKFQDCIAQAKAPYRLFLLGHSIPDPDLPNISAFHFGQPGRGGSTIKKIQYQSRFMYHPISKASYEVSEVNTTVTPSAKDENGSSRSMTRSHAAPGQGRHAPRNPSGNGENEKCRKGARSSGSKKRRRSILAREHKV